MPECLTPLARFTEFRRATVVVVRRHTRLLAVTSRPSRPQDSRETQNGPALVSILCCCFKWCCFSLYVVFVTRFCCPPLYCHYFSVCVHVHTLARHTHQISASASCLCQTNQPSLFSFLSFRRPFPRCSRFRSFHNRLVRSSDLLYLRGDPVGLFRGGSDGPRAAGRAGRDHQPLVSGCVDRPPLQERG